MKLPAGLEKVRAVLARQGPAGLIRVIRDRARPRDYAVYRCELGGRGVEPEFPGVRLGSLAELRAWRRNRDSMAPPFLADRTGGWVDFCWAWSGGQPVGIIWTTTRSPLLLTAAGEAVIVDLYTSLDFRGRGIASALIRAACQQLGERGFHAVYATVEIHNTSSRRVFGRSGFAQIGEFTSHGWLRHAHRTARWVGPART